jgi:flagellar hook assembly protein FlgD
MKTLVLTTALVVLTTASFAQSEIENKENQLVLNTEDVKASIFPNSNDMVTLILEKKPGEVVTIKIKEENGRLVYQKKIKKVDSTKIKFDIRELPDGEYTFELVKDKQVLYSKKINKSENVAAAIH